MNKPSYAIHIGDCLQSLRAIPEQSVHCCVTSPPYFGLRDYGVDGQIGLEQNPEEYIAKMVEVFREVRRVLRDDGTLWLNIGDSYANDTIGQGGKSAKQLSNRGTGHSMTEAERYRGIPEGLKRKDLIGIPWMLAFALRADGWYLRQDIIWHKPNPMPESVRDRCTKAHEYVFLLSKSERYFYDHDAVKEPAAYADCGRPSKKKGEFASKVEPLPGQLPFRAITETRNRRSVWTVATRPYKGAHFATFPPALIEPCILSGTSERGHCPACGARWGRVVQHPDFSQQPKRQSSKDAHLRNGDRTSAGQAWQEWRNANPSVTTGWSPSCDCGHTPVPDSVLDPFGGSGTTAGVALAHGRSAVLCELNEEYAALVPDRVDSILAAYGKPTVKRKAAAARPAADPQMALLL